MAEFLEVLFDVPRLGALSYRNDEGRSGCLGRRVAAPFGRREATGFVVGESDSCDLPADKLKRITRVIDASLPKRRSRTFFSTSRSLFSIFW